MRNRSEGTPKVVPDIKVSSPEEVEEERKISEIKQHLTQN